MELNNGTPSGGTLTATWRTSLLSRLLEIIQYSHNLSEVRKQLMGIHPDYSLVINTANTTHTDSVELSTTLGVKSNTPDPDIPFASTNFYLNSSWGKSIPVPTDSATWNGVTRRNNIYELITHNSTYTPTDALKLMNVTYEEGGALWQYTIYQMVYDSERQRLYVRATNAKPSGYAMTPWADIPLDKYFTPTWMDRAYPKIEYIFDETISSFFVGFSPGFSSGVYESLLNKSSPKALNLASSAVAMYLCNYSSLNISAYLGMQLFLQDIICMPKKSAEYISWSVVFFSCAMNLNPISTFVNVVLGIVANSYGQNIGSYFGSKAGDATKYCYEKVRKRIK